MNLPRPQRLILGAVGRLQYLSAFQLNRLLYGNALKHVQEHCAQLVSKSLLTYTSLPTDLETGGRARRIYALKRGAQLYLPDPNQPYQFGSGRAQPLNLKHTLAINDIIILAHQYKKANDCEMSFLAEWQLKTSPSGGVCPDACIMITQDDQLYPLVIEVDRGTEDRKIFKRKLSALIQYTQGAYRAHLDTDFLSIAYIDASGQPRRLRDMVRWTEQELEAHGAKALAPIFLFRSMDTSSIPAYSFFLSPAWQIPFSDDQDAIISHHC